MDPALLSTSSELEVECLLNPSLPIFRNSVYHSEETDAGIIEPDPAAALHRPPASNATFGVIARSRTSAEKNYPRPLIDNDISTLGSCSGTSNHPGSICHTPSPLQNFHSPGESDFSATLEQDLARVKSHNTHLRKELASARALNTKLVNQNFQLISKLKDSISTIENLENRVHRAAKARSRAKEVIESGLEKLSSLKATCRSRPASQILLPA